MASVTMASSSIGSDVFAALALLFISAGVTLLLRQYLPLRITPAYLLVPVFLALALPSSIVLLVPIDLASSSGTDAEEARGIWLPERVMLVAWRIAYWLTFALTWLILPLLGEYCDSGYREPRDRFLYSLQRNARYQLTVLVVGIAGAVYFFTQSGFKGQSVKALVMALAYAWGLVLAIYLMGHGLVAIPRRLIRDARVSARLRRTQTYAPRVHDKLEEAMEELDDVEAHIAQLRQRKTGMTKDLQEWVRELYDTSALPESRPSGRVSSSSAPPPVVTSRYLAELARKVKRARHKKARFVGEWDSLVREASRLQAILDSSASKRLEFRAGSSRLANIPLLTPHVRYYLYAYIIPYLRTAFGIILALASIALIWSEFVLQLAPKLSVVGLTVVHHPSSSRGQIGLAGQVIAAVWLSYMCIAALYSVSEVKVWGNRALVRRQTYAESACWYSLQVAKLTVPLSFNFITMMPRDIYQETTFYKFLGKLIDLTPLGEGFSAFFPILVLLPVCATLFNLYGKIKNVVGFGVLEAEDENDQSGFGTGGWREGRVLIERELQNDGAHVGLASSNQGLLTGLSTPPSRASLDNTARASRPAASRANVARNDAERSEREEEDTSDRYFFQDFTQRVRNTYDTTERPGWVRDIGESFKKPKWMSGGQSSNSDSGNNILGRLFGGRATEGNVRL
ncbi:hypothetical protein MBLNU459_g3592t1 [Dothideomycetes sp. NU459]